MNLSDAQAELRSAYLRGGPGAIVSGVVWLTAGWVASQQTLGVGFAVLFFGGMLIFPLSWGIVRLLCGCPAPAGDNPGGTVVVETVFPMIGGLFAAWLLMPTRPEFVFPVAAIAVGAHYFGFQTAYGDKVYWGFAAAICLLALASIFFQIPAPQATLPLVIGMVEICVGSGLTWSALIQRRSVRKERPSDQIPPSARDS